MSLPKPQRLPEDDLEAIIVKQLANEQEWDRRATEAQAQAAHAFARLLRIAESSDTGQSQRVASFIAATFDGSVFHFDLFDLRATDVDISGDMLVCLDALRWGKEELYKLVPDGETRINNNLRVRSVQSST
jgi:hypothetical protein